MKTELEKLKVLSALRLGYGKLTGKNTTEKEFENIEKAIEIVKNHEVTTTDNRRVVLEDFFIYLDSLSEGEFDNHSLTGHSENYLKY